MPRLFPPQPFPLLTRGGYQTLRTPAHKLRDQVRLCWSFLRIGPGSVLAPFLQRLLAKKEIIMTVLTKFRGIVIRLLFHQTFGTHYHAFYGDSELVIALNPLRIIQGDAPSWVGEWALDWVKNNRGMGLPQANFTVSPAAAARN